MFHSFYFLMYATVTQRYDSAFLCTPGARLNMEPKLFHAREERRERVGACFLELLFLVYLKHPKCKPSTTKYKEQHPTQRHPKSMPRKHRTRSVPFRWRLNNSSTKHAKEGECRPHRKSVTHRASKHCLCSKRAEKNHPEWSAGLLCVKAQEAAQTLCQGADDDSWDIA